MCWILFKNNLELTCLRYCVHCVSTPYDSVCNRSHSLYITSHFYSKKINCKEHNNVLSSNFIQSSGHIKFIYAIMCAFLKEFTCERAYSF